MVNREKLEINGKEYVLKCSIATAEYYERLTGNKFGKTLSDIIKMQKGIEELSSKTDGDVSEEYLNYLLENVLEMQLNVLKMAYCMIMEAKKDNDNTDFNMSLDQWLSSVEVVNTNTIKGVLAVAIGLFPRKVQE